MVNTSETILVNDGANCAVTARSTTNRQSVGSDIMKTLYANPTWLIHFTLFHGAKDDDRKIEMLTQKSWEKESSTFKRVPDCYFEKLEKYMDVASLYRSLDLPNDVMYSLLRIDSDDTLCLEKNFDERYIVSTVLFANNDTQYLTRSNQCTWPSIVCNQFGKVQRVVLSNLTVSKIENMGYLQELLLLESLDLSKFDLFPISTASVATLKRFKKTYSGQSF